MKYTHDCIRTIAFTTPCTADGDTSDEDLRKCLLNRIADVQRCGEWQEACGQDFDDLCELEKEVT